jgi:D-alanyl-D-alanine dipeptidase
MNANRIKLADSFLRALCVSSNAGGESNSRRYLRSFAFIPAILAVHSGKPADMVDVTKISPAIRIELRYGTPRNGVGRAVYPKDARCLLRRSVAERLVRVQKRLEARGFGLKVWDGYRPASAQRALWEIKPDRRFVAPPQKGSKHNRGAAVDLTIVTADGDDLPLPCDFDTFDIRSRPTYTGGTREQRKNRVTLRAAMVAEGFIPDRNEWWHFNAPDWQRFEMTEVSIKPD